MKKFYFLLLSFLALSLCANAVEKTVKFDFSDPTSFVNESGVAYETDAKFETGTKLFVNGNSDVLFEYKKINTSRSGFYSGHIRVYKNDIFYVKINNGVDATIKSVSFTYSEPKYTDSNFKKTVSADNKSLTYEHNGGQNRYVTMTVVYDVPVAAGEVEMPTFSPAGGTYYAPQEVTIQIPAGAEKVMYTTDGTEPSYANSVGVSITENTPITVSKTTTIKAIAIKGKNESAVAEATYTILPSFPNTQATAYTTAEAIALIDATSSEQLKANPVFVKGKISSVTSLNNDNSITYLLDGGAFMVFKGMNIGNVAFEAKEDLAVGASVIVYGNITKYNSTYELNSGNYLVEYTAPATTKSIAINGEATKTEYAAGETFSTQGLEVVATLSDGSTLDVTSAAVWTIEPKTLAVETTTVEVTAKYDGFSASKDVAVTVTPAVTLDLTTTAQIKGEPTEDLLEYDANVLTVSSARTNKEKTAVNNYYPGSGQTSTRFYTGNSLTFTPAANFEIVSITYNATSEKYATALATSTWTNASATADVKTVTITPVDGTQPFSATIGGTTGATSMVIKYRVKTVTGLDAVLDAAHAGNVGGQYRINCALHVNYKDDNYVYASTIGGGSKATTPTEAQKKEWWSDKEDGSFNQNDWVAIQNSGLNVGDEIEVGSVATLVSNGAFPVVEFDKERHTTGTAIKANTFRVANFNIGDESPLVNKLWLVAPQPAEYCKVKAYVNVAYVYETGLFAQSGSEATVIEGTSYEPLDMTVNLAAADDKITESGWYVFEGIVIKNGKDLELNAISATVGSIETGVEGVESSSVKVYGAEGVINVESEEVAPIAVYSANGAIVSSVEASSASIAVAPGFYIVKAGNSVSKVTVK